MHGNWPLRLQDEYVRNAVVTKVYDGDTVTVDIDLGFGSWLKGQKLRLAGINAPEVRGASRTEGLITRDWLRERVLGKTVKIRTLRSRNKGKYGRWLAFIHDDFETSLNSEMVTLGLATVYK